MIKKIFYFASLDKNRCFCRPAVVANVVIYTVIFCYLYIKWASVVYPQLGFSYAEDRSLLPLSFLVVLLVALMMPMSVRGVRDFILWFLMFFVFIPSVVSVSLQHYVSFHREGLIASLTVSFLLIVGVSALGNQKSLFRPISASKPFLGVFCAISLLLYVYVIPQYSEVLRFVTFGADVYVQRAKFAAASAEVSTFTWYLLNFIAYVINPFLIAVGLCMRGWWPLVLVALLGQLLVYAGFAGKMMLVVVGVQIAFFLVLGRRGSISVPVLTGCFVVLILVPFVVLELTGYRPSGIWYEIAALVYMRSLAIQGVLTGAYADFYAAAANTYWSHSRLLSWLIEYPHEAPPGIMVGNHMSPTGKGMNANANFWATDGVAAAGNLGVLAIGALFGGILAIMNVLIHRDRLVFACTALIPFCMAVSNTSLLQSMFTGGGIFMVVLIVCSAPVQGFKAKA